ncbi:proton-coupled amino acid transporter-like protein pathetic [Pectinophora gossypiella]|uniref:proton-coupled amino acid transporter-like protein pathetic n=1 Tax=Pectinophora gossypiella TaxID=13191 RepID=UPI00214E3404|nr:proton-coupled amino acid transporter-like protein pathetic [Pectinophora gossypiella]
MNVIEADPSTYSMKTPIANYLENTFSSAERLQSYPGVERNEYDFTSERHNLYTSNLIESTAHLIKGCLGAGILGMHEAYMRGGLWASLGVTGVIAAVLIYNMLSLIKSAQTMYLRLRVPKLPYPDLVEVVIATGPWTGCRKFSKIFRHGMEIMLVIGFCCTCNIYQIMMATTFKEVLEDVSETVRNWRLLYRTYVIILTIPLLLLCCIRKIKYLSGLSIVADIFVVMCVATALSYSIAEIGDISLRPAFKDINGLFNFAGVFLFSIDGLGISLSIENNMYRPKYFPLITWFAMTIVVLSVTVVGFFGYWAWGESCHSPITMHMPPDPFPIILQFALTIVLAVSFSVNFWIPFKIFWHYMSRKFSNRNGHWERFFRCIHVLLITCFSLLTPNLNKFMGLANDHHIIQRINEITKII